MVFVAQWLDLAELARDGDARLPASRAMRWKASGKAQAQWGECHSVVEALLQACVGQKFGDNKDRESGAMVESLEWEGALVANFASGHGLVVSGVIDSGVH